LDVLRAWLTVLGTERKDEAVATFAYENITREVFVLFEGNDGEHYVIGCNEVSGERRPGDPEVKINQEHAQVRQECLEPISERGEILLDLIV